MGCGKSSGPTPEAARRRLSVGEVDKSQGDSNEAATETDRGTLQELEGQEILAMIQEGTSTGGRKFSIGSDQDQGKTSFANKTNKTTGKATDEDKGGLGYTCRKGLKPESPNQDSWSILKLDNFALYGVFDGHGQKGHDVSNMVKDDLFKLILKDQRFMSEDDTQVCAMLMDVFKKMQNLVVTADRLKKVSAQLSGTTASVAVHDIAKQKLFVAHVADSTVCMASWTDESKSKLKCKALTRDHKPDLKDERARIEKNGGRVVFDGYANHRIYAKTGRYPGLNMSRCLGDLLGHADAGVSCEPEVNVFSIGPLDHILFLCSDGVWEFMQPQEAADIVTSLSAENCQAAADKLAKEAWDRWIREEGGAVVDDITAVLVYLQSQKPKTENNKESNNQ